MKKDLHPFNRIVLDLGTADLPPYRYSGWNPPSMAIAAYFRRLMEQHLTTDAVAYLQLPSVMELADFFGCCETEIFEALCELKHQSYNYEIHGLNSPIRLRDPLLRKPTNLKFTRVPLDISLKGA